MTSGRWHGAVAIALALCSASASAVQVVVETIAGRRIEGEIQRLAEDGVFWVAGANGQVALPVAEVFTLRASSDPLPAVPDLEPGGVWLRGGSVLAGELKAVDGEEAVLRVFGAGETRVALDRLVAVAWYQRWRVFGEALHEAVVRQLARRSAGRDVLIVRRGEGFLAVDGALESWGPEGGVFAMGSRRVSVGPDRVAAIVFAAMPGSPEKPAAEVRLLSGERIRGTLASADGDVVRVNSEVGVVLERRWQQVHSIRFYHPHIVLLSTLRPLRAESEPFLDVPWEPRFDRALSGGPIRLDGMAYESGVAVHSRTVLEYALPRGATAFVATIGIDDAVRPLGNVVFRVYADGAVRFDSGPVAGTDRARTIRVDLRGAQRLGLEVDYGGALDIGDHADWAEARVLLGRQGATDLH